MLNFFNLQPEVFGVDVNDVSLRIAKLKKKRKGYALISYNEVALKPGVIQEGVIQDPEAFTTAIASARKTVRGKKLGDMYAVVSLPEEKSFSQVIQMPLMTETELSSAIMFEAENYIPLPIEKVYLGFEVINHQVKTQNHLDVLINVMPKSIVDSYVTCFQKAGITPCAMEVESQAIARALIKKGLESVPVIFIDLGNANTSFILFSGNSIHFTASIPVSSNQFTQAIATKLGVTYHKAEELKIKYGVSPSKSEKRYDVAVAMKPLLQELVAQVKKYLAFYREHALHQYFPDESSIQKVVLSGGGANLKGLGEYLADQLKIPVELGDPFVNIIGGTAPLIAEGNVLSSTTVLGLALRGTQAMRLSYHD